jgi:hypothetical protein
MTHWPRKIKTTAQLLRKYNMANLLILEIVVKKEAPRRNAERKPKPTAYEKIVTI